MGLWDLNLQGRTLSKQGHFSAVFVAWTVQVGHQDHCDWCLRSDVRSCGAGTVLRRAADVNSTVP
jgi:hypothetical protein